MRILQGVVTSLKMQKTVTVTVTRYKKHPKYQKRYLVSRKYHAHYEGEQALALGDKVAMLETKPISKLKHWLIISPAQETKLIAQAQVKRNDQREASLKLKGLKDERSATLAVRKRKINSNKRKATLAATPAAAAPEAPAPEAPAPEAPAAPVENKS